MPNHRTPIVGVMGGAQVEPQTEEQAFELGAAIAGQGWILLNGGRNAGVMRESARGAKSRGGLTIGILMGKKSAEANPFIDIVISTGIADARNLINVLSSDVVVACRGSAGTLSEIALALKNHRPVILLDPAHPDALQPYARPGQLFTACTVPECLTILQRLLNTSHPQGID